MKKPMIFILFLSATNAIHALETKSMETTPVTVTVNNIKTERGGQLIVFVFSQHGFPKKHGEALMTFISAVEDEKVNVAIQVPANQEFAIKVLHDEDMDGKVTKNWTGIIPKEGLGFSNGARMRFGPPGFADTSVRYTEDLTPVITLQY